MKIVKAGSSGRKRVEIVFDDGQIITLAFEIFLKNHLKINQVISDEFLSALINEDQKYLVKQSALNYIARRHHSKNEIKTKLLQKKFDKILIEQTLNDLEAKKYVDDITFSRLFTDEKIKSKRWGKNKIKAELMKRGVASQVISNVIEENFGGETEIEAGLELARNKLKKLMNRKMDEKKIQVNLYSFLVSRGYDYDACKQIIYKLFKDAESVDL